MDIVAQFREQARACADLGSPMYAGLLDLVADDIAARGVCADILAGHQDDPGSSALALRLLGSVHRLVLGGQAPALAVFYPSVGGASDLPAGWRAFDNVLRAQPDQVRAGLDRPPQTNEVGRAGALMGGLLQVDAARSMPVRLMEIGSSGGLNLRVDRYGYTDQDGRRYGDPDAALVMEGAWAGRVLEPGGVRIVERLGSDVMPVDVHSDEGRLTLMSYVWPDQITRFERLRAALAVAAVVPAEVRRQDAVAFLDDLTLQDGVCTVLWHSVMWQYLSAPDKRAAAARIQAIGESASPDRPFAHLSLEPEPRTPEFLVVLRTWPGGAERVLGTASPHGIPAIWS